MKWIIASDLHGSAHYCRRLLEAWKREEAPRMLFLGDLLYHGPRNDLPEGYAPKEVIALLQERQADIFCGLLPARVGGPSHLCHARPPF